ncbi:glycosyltransferase [Proteus mirabilis]|uniref:glycosyltransferase n=1 Tax=Proteus mirabilis TaxID=584 RepID=UPI001A327712|nr:glycosyltransferase [Proteus mirabilis]EKW9421989.1 glycosyltransferase [Proteus mirabilis]MBI6391758.1 glycosyltransferase [Proteus mirabilis]MCI9768197.1 glycosyltransferase [Proteus mirabilis]MCI9771787.1 glycosyltransferase [Proteus mirabilis]MCI9775379.1 glycosyltransferase [Proteus mirabilis]
MLKVIVSTMDGNFKPEYFPEGEYEIIIVNQGKKCNLQEENEYIKVINSNTLGLSNSRNIGLTQCNEDDIIIFTDNDVSFYKDFDKLIYNIFLLSNKDIVTFKVKNIHEKPFKNNYINKKFKHNLISIMKVSSIEIALKYNKKIKPFDNSFGLGTSIPLGEENIFLSDNIKANQQVYFEPVYLCKHMDDNHSGANFNKKTFYMRWKIFKRIYGKLVGSIIFLIFNIKNLRKYFIK